MSSTKNLDPDICRVCGWKLPDVAEETCAICACCGTQRGYEDLSLQAIESRRQTWLKTGMHWFDETEKPRGWTPEAQLALVDVRS